MLVGNCGAIDKYDEQLPSIHRSNNGTTRAYPSIIWPKFEICYHIYFFVDGDFGDVNDRKEPQQENDEITQVATVDRL